MTVGNPRVFTYILEEANLYHLVDMDRWTDTVQKAVTAIRKAGAKSQLILLPGKTDLTRFSARLLTKMQL